MNHRKLISDTVTVNITAFCEPYCDPREGFFGTCPDLCFYDCPSSCNLSPPHVTITTIHRSRAHDNLHRSLIVVLSFIGLACFLYSLFNIYKHYKSMRRRRLRPLQAQQQQTRDLDEFLEDDQGPILDHPIWYIRTVGLETPVINSISVCRYKRGEGLVEGTDCSVCLSEFEDDETLRLLPKCNHAFHVPCIDTWLGSHTNCPLCRAPIVSAPNGSLYPSLEQSFVGSVTGEENRLAASEESEEVARGRNNRDFGSKSAGSSRYWRRINEDEGLDEVPPIRKSFSMDSLAIANGNVEELNKMNTSIVMKGAELNRRVMMCAGGSSFKRSLQKGLVLMKRSSSCSGKFLFSG